MASICVIGAGPAGSTYATRMAQLGHEVSLFERDRFPRRHVGESLSPGVLPLLASIGAEQALERSRATRVRRVQVTWDGAPQVRENSREEAWAVDRAEFDQHLLENARRAGVRVLQPAHVRACRRQEYGWTVRAVSAQGACDLPFDFVAHAGGRTTGPRKLTGRRTVALFAYWQSNGLPTHPRIEAGANGWYWGVPLPDGTYNTLAFVDPAYLRLHRKPSLADTLLDLLQQSSLKADCARARRVSEVRAVDATASLAEELVTDASIRLGEAALAIDPISSSGVQKAIQGSMAAAIVSNTLLRRPGDASAAFDFYRTMLQGASARHAQWAAAHYARAAATRSGSFWTARGETAALPEPGPRRNVEQALLQTPGARLCEQLRFGSAPCLGEEFVKLNPAVFHPNLATPVAYVGGHALEPLLRRLRAGASPLEIARAWSTQLPLSSGLAIVSWLLQNGLLVHPPHGNGTNS